MGGEAMGGFPTRLFPTFGVTFGLLIWESGRALMRLTAATVFLCQLGYSIRERSSGGSGWRVKV